MPRVSPFTGLLYAPSAGDPTAVTAPPYDAISDEERETYLSASPHNVVRLILPQDEPESEAGSRYEVAARTLNRWREAGVLVETEAPAVYPYEMAFELDGAPRRVRGLLATIDLEPFGDGVIPHERTMPGPVEDRLRLLRATRANLSPVYAVLPGPCAPQADLMERAAARPPDRQATDPAGVVHRLWVEPEVPEALIQAYASDAIMIADGHHRYTTALAYRDEMRAERGPGPWDRMLMLLVDAATEDPPVRPIHRVVRGEGIPAPGFPVDSLQAALRMLSDHELRFGVVSANGDGVQVRVAELDGRPPTVAAIHERILSRYPDAEVTYVPDAEQAVREVGEGATLAYLLPPTHAGTIRAVVERGERLPQKSTWFWPKPRSGMVIRPLD
ncbi:MAG: DUF1015 family protein [Actinobacteria bacterium]|nr:DUF1015 family protein [Actinomycetota bacterium]